MGSLSAKLIRSMSQNFLSAAFMLAFTIQPVHVKLFLDFVTLRFGGFAIPRELGFMIKQKAKLDHRHLDFSQSNYM